MKKAKFDSVMSMSRLRMIQVLMGFLFLYILLMSLEIPLVLKTGFGFGSFEDEPTNSLISHPFVTDFETLNSESLSSSSLKRKTQVSSLFFDETAIGESSELQRTAKNAYVAGKEMWAELESGKIHVEMENSKENVSDSCKPSFSVSGEEFLRMGQTMMIPCGLTLGSHITVVGKPKWAHVERDPTIALVREGDEWGVLVSQFMMELQGLRNVDGEDPPRVLHFNPRLKGDFSGRPVIEQNTCYRMQWGTSLRCDGWRSKANEETVDGQVKCEKWIRDDDDHSEESKTSWWLNRLIGRKTKVTVDWPFPFAENKMFVLTLSAGLEGYHVTVDGRHVTSFPYRIGFTLEDATGLSIRGDIDVNSIYAASLPTSHPSFAPQRQLEMSTMWRASPLPNKPVTLFIGILSAGNHFSERMAVRKSWMQHSAIKSSKFVARFFVALHGRKEVNAELMKEAEFFGDIVIVPYMDNYDLVVLKTVAICEYGIRKLAAEYIMKCDDDTFVRIDAVMREVRKVRNKSVYVGNINYYHKPLRYGKWAVTYEEWPEEDYPPYANGPGYVVSSDIAHFIVSEFENHKLRLFKMEDVSMGMWVEQFNISRPVEYVHSLKFCQHGCIEDYFTAHYQSPRQMICLWDKLQKQGKAQCCNMR